MEIDNFNIGMIFFGIGIFFFLNGMLQMRRESKIQKKYDDKFKQQNNSLKI